MSTANLDMNTFSKTLGAGTIILISYMLKEVNLSDIASLSSISRLSGAAKVQKYVSMAIFILGWSFMVFMTGYKRPDKIIPITVSVMIAISTLAIWITSDWYGWKNIPKWSMIFYAIYAFAWILFGYMLSRGKSGSLQHLGLLAPVLIITSMLFVVPWQKAQCYVEGPGMVMYTLGWVFIALINAC